MGRLKLGESRLGGTGISQQLLKAVRACGFDTEEEVRFAPYQVDIYVPELHTAFEADGPTHVKHRDVERDKYLFDTYQLHVLRFPQKEIKGLEALTELVRQRVLVLHGEE